jgi:hypothetical protein
MKKTISKLQSRTLVQWLLSVFFLTGMNQMSVAQNCEMMIACPSDITVDAGGQCNATVDYNPSVTFACATLQEDQSSPDGGYITNPKNSSWQSFTPSSSGLLRGVGVEGWWTNTTTGYTLNIYSGDGTGGTLLYSQAVTLPNSGPGILDLLNLSPGVAVTGGQQYTWELTNGTAFRLIGYPWASYAGGHGDEYQLQPGWQGMDYHFATYMVPNMATVVCTPPSGSTFNIGTTTVNATATDEIGNTVSCSFTVTVVDNTAPSITCPNNISVNAANGQCSAAVNFNISVSDNCAATSEELDQTSPDGGYITDPKTSSWQSFTAGVTGQLTGVAAEGWWTNTTTGYTLNIYSGVGTGGTLLHSQSVTLPNSGPGILDNLSISPGVSLTAGQQYTWQLTNATAFRLIGYPWASYAGGQGDETGLQPGWQGMDYHFATYMIPASYTLVCSPASGSTFNVGTTTVNATATDLAGNISTCSFIVTVTDNQPPTIEAPASITVSACGSGSVSLGNASATDNCAIASITNSHPSSTFPVGTTVVTWTATDVNGNSSTATQTVTVNSGGGLTVNAGPNEITYYGFTADQAVTHTAVVSGGTAPFNYTWTMNRPLRCNQVTSAGDEMFSSGSCTFNSCPSSPLNVTLSSPPVCNGNATVTAILIDTTLITVTVTDANGCSGTSSFWVYSEDARCFAGNSSTAKVQICHRNNNSWFTICVDQDAVAAHLAHGDYVGRCSATHRDDIGMDEESTSMLTAYPNPFNGSTTIAFSVPTDGNAIVRVFDAFGKQISVLFDGIAKAGTLNKVEFNGENYAPGIYFYSILSENMSETKRMELLK